MSTDHNVTIEQVRASLNGIDSNAIPDATIDDALDDAALIVDSRLPSDWETSDVLDLPDDWDAMTQTERDEWKQARTDNIIKHVAKRKAFNSSGAEVNVSAMEASVSLDINEFRAQLRRDVEDAWEMIGFSSSGTRAAFIDATRHLGGELDNP